MKKQIVLKNWRIELSWQGIAIKRINERSRYREIRLAPASQSAKLQAWAQAAEVFIPGGRQLAEAPVAKLHTRVQPRRNSRRRSL